LRAIQIEEFGGPEVLELVELPIPEPGPGELLVKTELAGINFADTHQRENQYVKRFELPLVLGGEVAGTVERAGAGFQAGQRVVSLLPSGGYAEHAVAPVATTFALPDELSYDMALALLIQGLTAWHLYRTCAHLAAGETVVVISGAGGVGSLAVQLGKPLGAGRVIATASTPEKRARCLGLGADVAIDPGVDDLTAALIEGNGGEPVDAVFEIAGGRVFDACIEALAPFGRIVAYGIASREQNEVATGRLMRKSRSVIGFWLMHLLERRELLEQPLRDLFERAARGELQVVVGETYPLGEVARAHEDLAARRTSGKLLLDPTR